MAQTFVNGRSSLQTDPIRNFRFLATFQPHGGFDAAVAAKLRNATIGFTSISGLSVTTESIPYREGGYNTAVHQVPGQTSFSPITFQRGVTIGSSVHWDWMRQLFRVVQGTADGSGVFRSDIIISVLQHPTNVSGSTGITPQNLAATSSPFDHVAMRFKVYNAWITSVAYSDLNAGDNAIMVEQMTVVHEGIDTNWSESWDGTAPLFD